MVDTTRRRRFLQLVGTGTVAGLAGCGGSQDGTTTEPETTESDSDGGGGGGGGGGEETTTEDASASMYGGHVRISSPRVQNGVNPFRTDVMDERALLGMMYSTLTYLDYDMQPQSDLATDWSANDDLTSWTFDLREDATFHHDGSTVTAEDVSATIDTLYDPDVGAPGSGLLGPVTGTEAPDDTTVVVNLDAPTPDFPKFASKKVAGVLPADVIESEDIEHFTENEYGSGPFVLEEFEAGNQSVLTRFEDFHLSEEDNQLPYVDKMTWYQVPEFSTEMTRFTEGETDILWQTSVTEVARLEATDGITPYSKPSGTNLWVVMNHNAEPFDDPLVREALALAVDREKTVNNVLQGQGVLGKDSIISPAYEFYEDFDSRTQDLERAQELLAEAGYPDGFHMEQEFGHTLYSAQTPRERLNMAISIQQDWQEIGVTAPIEQVTYDRYISEIWRSAPLYAGYYGTRFSVSDWMNLVAHSEGAWKDENGYVNEELDSLIEQGDSTNDPEERQEAYGQAQQIMHDDVMYIVPCYMNQVGAKWDYVNNYETHSMPMKVRAERAWLGEGAPGR